MQFFTFVTCNAGLNTEPCCFWRTCLCTFFSSFFIVGPAMQVSYVLPPVLETEHRRHVHDYHLHERVRRHWRLFHGIVTCSHAVPGLLLGVSCVHSQNCPMDQKTQNTQKKVLEVRRFQSTAQRRTRVTTWRGVKRMLNVHTLINI
jgi:hypothetical protein